jgi:hypothetical protein
MNVAIDYHCSIFCHILMYSRSVYMGKFLPLMEIFVLKNEIPLNK